MVAGVLWLGRRSRNASRRRTSSLCFTQFYTVERSSQSRLRIDHWVWQHGGLIGVGSRKNERMGRTSCDNSRNSSEDLDGSREQSHWRDRQVETCSQGSILLKTGFIWCYFLQFNYSWSDFSFPRKLLICICLNVGLHARILSVLVSLQRSFIVN